MKSLLNPRDREITAKRVSQLRPDAQRRWGRMNAHQMVCHLTDAYRGLLASPSPNSRRRKPNLLGRTLIKWLALYAPMPWPHGTRTRAEIDQEKGGTRPTEFELDMAALEANCDRFLHNLDTVAERPHFIFGKLSREEWGRWAYLHTDHHLRQFGL
ncbi:MAG TPA: DUF1569 domain-containing protein [Gemmatimonadaceae bacterium]|jgi:hypothetical protein